MMLMSLAPSIFHCQTLASNPSWKDKKKQWHHVNIIKCVDGMFAPGGNYFVIEKIIKYEG